MRPIMLAAALGLAAASPAAAEWDQTPATAPDATPAASSGGGFFGGGSAAPAPEPTPVPGPAPVLGTWLCDLSDPSEPGMAGSRAEIEYRADGTSTARAELHYPAAEGPGILTMAGKGRWRMEDGRLVEALTDYTILSLSEGRAAQAWSEVDPSVRKLFEAGFESMRGVESSSTIERGTGGRLILTDQSGAVSDCLPK